MLEAVGDAAWFYSGQCSHRANDKKTVELAVPLLSSMRQYGVLNDIFGCEHERVLNPIGAFHPS